MKDNELSYFKIYPLVFWRYIKKELTYKEFKAELARLDSLRSDQGELFKEEEDLEGGR